MAKNKNLSGLWLTSKDDWETPKALYYRLDQIFHFDLDASATTDNTKCSNFISPEENALITDWKSRGDRAFLNPPYGKAMGAYVTKMCMEAEKGVTIVTLVPDRLGSNWFKKCLQYSRYYLPFYKRIQFEMNGIPVKRSTFANVIFIFSTQEWDLTSLKDLAPILQLF